MILQRAYLRETDPKHRPTPLGWRHSNRLAVTMIALSGAVVLWQGHEMGLYLLPLGILLSFVAARASAWVLLIEINR